MALAENKSCEPDKLRAAGNQKELNWNDEESCLKVSPSSGKRKQKTKQTNRSPALVESVLIPKKQKTKTKEKH